MISDQKDEDKITFIPKKSYDAIWAINPHELNNQKLKHSIEGEFKKYTFKGSTIYKAQEIRIELVTGIPDIRK